MDIARGHVAALKQIVDPTFHGVKIYNLGTGKGVTPRLRLTLTSCTVDTTDMDSAMVMDT